VLPSTSQSHHQHQVQALAIPQPPGSATQQQRWRQPRQFVPAQPTGGTTTPQQLATQNTGSSDQQASMVALCNMLWALSNLQCRPPYMWVGRALHLSQPHLGGLGPKEHSCLLYSLGRLGFSPSHSWSHAELAQVTQQWLWLASSSQGSHTPSNSPQQGAQGTGSSSSSGSLPTAVSADGPPQPESQHHQPSGRVHRQLWHSHELACSLWGLSQMQLSVAADAAAAFQSLWEGCVGAAAPSDVVMVVDAVTHQGPPGSGPRPRGAAPEPVLPRAAKKAVVMTCITQVRARISCKIVFP
jgi:hypothetical protein